MAHVLYGLWLLLLVFLIIICGVEASTDPTVTFQDSGGGMAVFFFLLTGAPVIIAVLTGLGELGTAVQAREDDKKRCELINQQKKDGTYARTKMDKYNEEGDWNRGWYDIKSIEQGGTVHTTRRGKISQEEYAEMESKYGKRNTDN